jgi:RHS repeat-associated protein
MPYTGRENCFSRTLQSPYLYTSFATYEHPCGVRFNPSVLAELALPNGKKYTFEYNTYGEITKVNLPTGGYHGYIYGEVTPLDFNNYDPLYGQTNRGVTQQRVCVNGGCTPAQEYVWNYSAANTGSVYTSSVTAPDSSRSEQNLHVTDGSASYGFDNSRAARAYEQRVYNAGNQMLRRTLTEWTETPGPNPFLYSGRDARVNKTVEILLDTGGNALAATTTTGYDADLNVITASKYDYASVNPTTAQTGAIGSIPNGALTRIDAATFLVNDPNYASVQAAYRARHLISLPTEQLVKNAAGTVIAATKLNYDEAAYPPLTYASVTGWTDPGSIYRGNATTTQRWQNFNGTSFQTYPSGSFIVTHAQPDQCGNVRKVWDANGKVTETFYDDTFSDAVNRNTYAYATRGESPIPDASGYYASAQSLKNYTTYDFQSGKVTKTKDPNNQETLYAFHPVNLLNRLQKITQPDGGETLYSYDDTPGSFYVRVRTKQNAVPVYLDDYTYFDGLGRPWRAGHFEATNSWSVKDTEYDSMGRVWKVSNPYFAANLSGALNPSGVWATTSYDALGRALTITTPDGSVVTTTYSGAQVTVADAMNRQRRSTTDALGRLSQVVEDPAGLNYATSYLYDVQGNLAKVTQGAQTRFFLYDSLSRLIRAKNPEQDANANIALTDPLTGNSQWSLKYVYDSNGNLISKTDPRNVTANYSYDAINRNIYLSYSDGTPTVERHYDFAANGKGRLYYGYSYNPHPVTGAAAHSYTVINSYDAVGRPLNQTQNVLNSSGAWIGYTVSRGYDLAGHVTSQTYPSGRTVSYSYNAGGRTGSFSGGLGDGVTRTYADTFSYNAAGQMAKERFGTSTNLYHNIHYNSRLQMVDIRLGTDGANEWTWNRGALIAYYSNQARSAGNAFLNATDNNGNVTMQEHYVPTDDAYSSYAITLRDTYEYDGVNRLTQTNGLQRTTAGAWNSIYAQWYNYDQWGNRTINTGATWGNAINNSAYTVSTSTNRVNGMAYDFAGNVTNDAGNAREYDAENRMKKAWGSSNWNYYVYDADGKRLRRIVGVTETWQVYGMGGELTAEYPANGAANMPQKEYGYRDGQMLVVGGCDVVRWIVADHLGTPRIEVYTTGTLSSVRRHDYLPFGEELTVGMGNGSIRTTGMGYPPAVDCVRQRYAGYERDNETNLDFAQARYYSNVQGRFTSPDPIIVTPERFFDPQQFNLYSYVRNNPLRYIDPTGETLTISGDLEEVKKQLREILGTDDAEKRVTFNEKTNTITVDFSGIDFEKNEGASVLNDVIKSSNVYDLSIGSSIETLGGQLKLQETAKGGSSIANLDNNPDDRMKNGKRDIDKPKKGVDDQIGLNFDFRRKNSKSITNLPQALEHTVTFHELAEAYAKVDGNMQYAQAHQKAIDRETKLREQRPYLKGYNPGSGPGTSIIIKK